MSYPSHFRYYPACLLVPLKAGRRINRCLAATHRALIGSQKLINLARLRPPWYESQKAMNRLNHKKIQNITARSLVSIFFLLALAQESRSQNINGEDFAVWIDQDDLAAHIRTLASSPMEGRETGKPGQKLAGHFIGNLFEALGLEGMGEDNNFRYPYEKPYSLGRKQREKFIQPFALDQVTTYPRLAFEISGRKYRHPKDIIFHSTGTLESGVTKQIRTVDSLPKTPQGDSQEWILVDFSGGEKPDMEGLRRNFAEAFGMILVVPPEIFDTFNRREGVFPSTLFAEPDEYRLLITTPGVSRSFAPTRETQDISITINTKELVRTTYAENVLGYFPGSERHDEFILLMGHYDHLGRSGKQMFPGADDNASGIATMLEIVEAFSKAIESGLHLRRSLMFAAFSGEEMGLLGSEHFANNPVVPMSQIRAGINIDMIGRRDTLAHTSDRYIYVIGTQDHSANLFDVSEAVNNRTLSYDLDYKYNDPNDPDRLFYRSDHYNLAVKGVPVLFYFAGLHEDYHQPTDTPEKIEIQHLQERGQLIFYTLWELVQGDWETTAK